MVGTLRRWPGSFWLWRAPWFKHNPWPGSGPCWEANPEKGRHWECWHGYIVLHSSSSSGTWWGQFSCVSALFLEDSVNLSTVGGMLGGSTTRGQSGVCQPQTQWIFWSNDGPLDFFMPNFGELYHNFVGIEIQAEPSESNLFILMQLAKTIFLDSTIFIEKKRVEHTS